jgi:chaperonin GroES
MNLKPLGDRLIVKAIEEEETTVSGIVLPDTAKEKPQKGKVVAVGDGSWDDDGEKRIPLDVSEGDEVLYSKYGGTEIKVNGDELLVLRESDVLAKVVCGQQRNLEGGTEQNGSQGAQVRRGGPRGAAGGRRRGR